MRFISSVRCLATLTLGLLFAVNALAADEKQLIDSINAYRSQVAALRGSGLSGVATAGGRSTAGAVRHQHRQSAAGLGYGGLSDGQCAGDQPVRAP